MSATNKAKEDFNNNINWNNRKRVIRDEKKTLSNDYRAMPVRRVRESYGTALR